MKKNNMKNSNKVSNVCNSSNKNSNITNKSNSITNSNKNRVTNEKMGFDDEESYSFRLDENDDHSFELR